MSITFTEREQKLMAFACQCFESEPKVCSFLSIQNYSTLTSCLQLDIDKVVAFLGVSRCPLTNMYLCSSPSAPASLSALLATPGLRSRRSCTLKRELLQRPLAPSRPRSVLPPSSCPPTTTALMTKKFPLPLRSPRPPLPRLRPRARVRQRPSSLRMRRTTTTLSRLRARSLTMTTRSFECSISCSWFYSDFLRDTREGTIMVTVQHD